jgi:hypothetical protein
MKEQRARLEKLKINRNIRTSKDAYGRDILQPGQSRAKNISITYLYTKFKVSLYNSLMVTVSYRNKYSAIFVGFKSDI